MKFQFILITHAHFTHCKCIKIKNMKQNCATVAVEGSVENVSVERCNSYIVSRVKAILQYLA